MKGGRDLFSGKMLSINFYIETIIRAHQLCMDGYSILFNGKIITVWSAPKYCGRFDNCASIMEVDENLDKFFNIFEDAESSSNMQNEEKKRSDELLRKWEERKKKENNMSLSLSLSKSFNISLAILESLASV